MADLRTVAFSCLVLAPFPTLARQGPCQHGSPCQVEVAAAHTRPSVTLLGLDGSGSVATTGSEGLLFPRDPSWFGGFAEGESTYDVNADGTPHNTENGWNPTSRVSRSNVAPRPRWYQESPSGGAEDAWQTHYPALDARVAGRGHARRWHETPSGEWVQTYETADLGGGYVHRGSLDPEFFDSSVNQIDRLGRVSPPHPHSPRRHLDWEERSVNTTLTCADPGCTANSTLVLFDPATEQVSHCHFGLHVHPTDFDDTHSGERLDWIQVAGTFVTTDCFPLVSGCRAEDEEPAPLFTCVQDYPIDVLVNASTGTVAVAAKISDVVDECPFEDNLLSAIPMVTCLVSPLPVTPEVPSPVLPVPLAIFLSTVTVEHPLRCVERGCEAHAQFSINQSDVIFDSCTMSVRVWQTDFDGDHDSLEQIDYINLHGEALATNATPGHNPCKSARLGTPIAEEDLEFEVVTDEDITEVAVSHGGLLLVEGKISLLVDECAHDGYLLDGMISVTCTLQDPAAAEAVEAEVEEGDLPIADAVDASLLAAEIRPVRVRLAGEVVDTA